jgi:cation diffusion facilitator family transporter
MAFESILRLIDPVSIAFDQAIGVAVVGLLVNGVSVFILGVSHDHGHEHGHSHEHHGHGHHHHHDHNLKSAYLHVLADALTSLLAIFTLLIGKYFGAVWMDPVMGIVGAILVARWSLGLLKSTSGILLDEQADEALLETVRSSIEKDASCTVVDLHIWTVAPGIHSAIISVVTTTPRNASFYKERLPDSLSLKHISIEVFYLENI